MKVFSPIAPINFDSFNQTVIRNQEASKRLERCQRALQSAIGPGLSIMIVGNDDLRSVYEYFRDTLRADSIFLSTATEALEVFQSTPTNLVVVDVRVQDIELSTMLRKFKEFAKDEPFASIVVTADSSAPKPANGVDSAITRPLQIQELLRIVKNMFNLKDTGEVCALVTKP